MARPLRIEFAGALYHVTSRGDGREAIVLGEEDRRLFLGVMSEVVQDFNWALHAYCLMGNHYHLLVETPDSNLSRGMRQLNGVYTQRFNRQHGRVGHRTCPTCTITPTLPLSGNAALLPGYDLRTENTLDGSQVDTVLAVSLQVPL